MCYTGTGDDKMNGGKTIKQIASELNVSKQAVWQRVKRNQELFSLLETHEKNVNGTMYVDETIEQLIKKMYLEHPPVNIDKTPASDETNIDEISKTDETKELIKTLQNTVESLKQQLTVKDGQIDELTSMLKTSQEQQTTLQEQNTTLVNALSAAQTLHAVTMQERHEEKKLDSQEKNSKTGLLARIFRKFGW